MSRIVSSREQTELTHLPPTLQLVVVYPEELIKPLHLVRLVHPGGLPEILRRTVRLGSNSIITRSFAYQFQSLAAESHLPLLVHLIGLDRRDPFSNSF